MTCVAIEVAEDGSVKVGLLPEGAAQQYTEALKPVQSLDDALGTARDLLSGQAGEQAQAAQAEGDFKQGFTQGVGAPAGRPVPAKY